MPLDPTIPTTKSTISDSSPKESPHSKPKGWKKKPELNLNDAEPLSLSDSDLEIPEPPKQNITAEIDKAEAQRFKPAKAISAFTDEDAALEAALQNMHLSQDMTTEKEVVLVTKEIDNSNFLGDLVENYAPAKNINELESQVFQAKTLSADSIEASEDIIRYFTRKDYPEAQGFFMYKDVRVFIPGRASGYSNKDKKNMYWDGV